jgi:hypothetical protein
MLNRATLPLKTLPLKRLSMKSRWSRLTALGSGMLLSLAMTLDTPAHAIGTSYNGQDPQATGCAKSAVTKAYADGNGFVIEFRWSTSCLTAWARIFVEHGAVDSPAAEIIAETAGSHQVVATYACHNLTYYDSTYSECYTPMVFDGSGYLAEAYGTNGPGTGVSVGWF